MQKRRAQRVFKESRRGAGNSRRYPSVRSQMLRNKFLRERAKGQGKIVVVFFCAGGVERSYIAEQEFKQFLGRIHMEKKFYVSHYGWQGLNRRLVASVARAADFVVPVGMDSVRVLSGLIEKLRVKPVLLRANFYRRGGLLCVGNYASVLRPIAKARPELGLKLH